MSTTAGVLDAIEVVVDAISGLTISKTHEIARLAGTISHDGYFVIDSPGGGDDEGSPGGDNISRSALDVTIELLQWVDPTDWTTARNAATGRMESIRNALDTASALASVDAYAKWVDWTWEKNFSPNYGLITCSFLVYHSHTYS